MAEMRNITGVFRTKIDEGIYSFDIMTVCSPDLYSSLIGYCVVNTRTGNYLLSVSSILILSEEEKEEITRTIFKQAKMIENVLEP